MHAGRLNIVTLKKHNMELRQLRFFLKASETLNFSEAAKQLYITQSTLTQAVKQLEAELGVLLFDRNSHEVHLTEAGAELVTYARQTVTAADTCMARMADLTQMKGGVLRVGVTHSFSLMTAEVVTAFCRLYPKVQIEIVYRRMEELLDMLCHHELDVVLSYKPTQVNRQVESVELFRDRLGVVVPQNHELASRSSLTLADIAHYSFALPAKGLQARNVLEHLLATSDITLNTRVELNIATPLLRLVRKSKMLTILSCSAVATNPDLHAIPLEGETCQMIGCFHTLKGVYRKRAVDEMLRLLKEYIAFYQM